MENKQSEYPLWKEGNSISAKKFSKEYQYLIDNVKRSIDLVLEKFSDKYSKQEIIDLLQEIYIADYKILKINKKEAKNQSEQEKQAEREKQEKINIFKLFESNLHLKKMETPDLILSAFEFIEKEADTTKNIQATRSEYEIKNVLQDWKTRKLTLSKEKTDISKLTSKKDKKDINNAAGEIERDPLDEDRVYSEIIIKIATPKEIAKNLKKLWEDYLSTADQADKIKKHKEFIKNYNEYTKALEKVLKVIYQDNPKLKTDLEQEIFNNLKSTINEETTLPELIALYEKALYGKSPNDETYNMYKQKLRLMAEELQGNFKPASIYLKAYKYIEMKNRGRKKYSEDKDFEINKYELKEFDKINNAKKSTSETIPDWEKSSASEEPKVDKIKIKTAFIAYSEQLAKAYARDVADRKMSQDYHKPVKGFLNRFVNGIKRTWKYGIWKEYYRQKEIAKAKEDILDKKNLFYDEDLTQNSQNNLNNDLIERLIQIDDLTQATHAGEKTKLLTDPEIKDKIIDVIRRYSFERTIGDAEFLDYQKQISEEINRKNEDVFGGTVINANNLLETARGLRNAYRHKEDMKNIDIDLDIIVGNMKSGVRTEQKLSTVDRLVDKMHNTKPGKFINETTLASSLSIALGIGSAISSVFLYNRVAAVASLGGVSLASGVLGSIRNRNYWEEKRRQHERDIAGGRIQKIDPKDSLRKTLERFRFQSISAIKTIEVFNNILNTIDADKDAVTKDQMDNYIKLLAAVESRIKLSDKRAIDLITYSNPQTIEGERTKIDIQRAQLKVKLRNLAAEKNWKFAEVDFDQSLKDSVELHANKLLSDSDGIDDKNKKFAQHKNKEAAKTFVRTTIYTALFGIVAQEVVAAFHPNIQGALESAFGHVDKDPTTQTALKDFTDFISNKHASSAAAFTGQREVFDVNKKIDKISLDAGKELRLDTGGNYDLYHNGKLISNDIISFEEGRLVDNLNTWKQHGLIVDEHLANTVAQNHSRTLISTEQFTNNNPDMVNVAGKRDWIINKTPGVYDFNERGINYVIDGNGNPVIDISQMTRAGSFDFNKNIDILEAIKQGNAKILVSVSRNTSGRVFELPLKSSSLVLDDNSPIKSFFSMKNGQVIFNGGTVEVAVKEPNLWNILASVNGSDSIKEFIINSTVPTLSRTVSITAMSNGVKVLPYILPPLIPINKEAQLRSGVKPEKDEGKKTNEPKEIERPKEKEKPKNTSNKEKEDKDKKDKNINDIQEEKNKKSTDNVIVNILKDFVKQAVEENNKKESSYDYMDYIIAGLLLAEIAKKENIDLSKLTRKEYVKYAIDKRLIIGDHQLRMASWKRNITSLDELNREESKAKKELINSVEDQNFDKFRRKVIDKASKQIREIDTNIFVHSATAKNSSWLYFKVNKGVDNKLSVIPKAYITVKDIKLLTPDKFIELMKAVRNAGYNCDIKIFQKLAEQGQFLNDQIVIHGNEKSDMEEVLLIAQKVFSSNFLVGDLGFDSKNKSYSQILAEKIEKAVKNKP